MTENQLEPNILKTACTTIPANCPKLNFSSNEQQDNEYMFPQALWKQTIEKSFLILATLISLTSLVRFEIFHHQLHTLKYNQTEANTAKVEPTKI